MAFQKHPDCFSTHARNQLTPDCLLSHQAYRPASPAFRRLTAHHGNNALLLGIVENLAGSRSLPFVQSALQAASVVAVGDLSDRLRSERNGLRNLRCRRACRQQSQRKGTQDNAHLLNSASQQGLDLSEILSPETDRDRPTSHAQSIAQEGFQ